MPPVQEPLDLLRCMQGVGRGNSSGNACLLRLPACMLSACTPAPPSNACPAPCAPPAAAGCSCPPTAAPRCCACSSSSNSASTPSACSSCGPASCTGSAGRTAGLVRCMQPGGAPCSHGHVLPCPLSACLPSCTLKHVRCCHLSHIQRCTMAAASTGGRERFQLHPGWQKGWCRRAAHLADVPGTATAPARRAAFAALSPPPTAVCRLRPPV